MVLFVFFFKQKTAYELRISDWSSDVCSSDLTIAVRRVRTAARRARSHPIALGSRRAWPLPHVRRADRSLSFARRGGLGADRRARARADARDGGLAIGAVRLVATADRTSVGEGKSVLIRLASGGSRFISKKTK